MAQLQINQRRSILDALMTEFDGANHLRQDFLAWMAMPETQASIAREHHAGAARTFEKNFFKYKTIFLRHRRLLSKKRICL